MALDHRSIWHTTRQGKSPGPHPNNPISWEAALFFLPEPLVESEESLTPMQTQ
jgi:hypothetical protein